MKRALITGIFGQDGSYLAELLFKMGYEVHGVHRMAASEHSSQLRVHLANKGIAPIIHACNLNEYGAVRELLYKLQPSECYHLAAVHYSAQVLPTEQLTKDRALFEQNTLSTLNLLCAIQEVSPQTRFVLAGSCMMYDNSEKSPQDGTEAFCSKSLYGLSKIAASQLTDFFRGVHGLHASTAILYNHESPRRQPYFVTRKIVQEMVKVKRDQIQYVSLGNLHSIKDWGYAGDYVHGMWLMAQAELPRSYVLATGRGRTIGDFVRETADVLGLPDSREITRVEAGLTRPPEQTPLIGDPRRAYSELGWKHSITFRQLVEMMVENELRSTLD